MVVPNPSGKEQHVDLVIDAIARQSLPGTISTAYPYEVRVTITDLLSLRNPISVRDYGAIGDGVADDTAAITAAFAAATAQLFAGGVALGPGSEAARGGLYFPAGNYIFSGAALDATTIDMVADGPNTARITLTNSDYFLKPTSLNTLSLRYLHITGGKGALKVIATGTNVRKYYEISGCTFSNYSECAIGSLASDMPAWKIDNNVFFGSSAFTSKGVCLFGLADNVAITRNQFLQNRHHIKLGNWGNSYIDKNDFIRWASPPSDTSDIWLVPSLNGVGNTAGMVVSNNKFGNENLTATDYRVLIAGEAAGADFVTKEFSTSDIGGLTAGAITFRDNQYVSIANRTRAFIASYTTDLRQVYIDQREQGVGSPKVPWIQILGAYAPSRLNQTNVIDLTSATLDPTEYVNGSLCVSPLGYAKDPFGLLQGQDNQVQSWTVGSDTSYAALYESATLSSEMTGPAAKAAITDAYASVGAARLTWASAADFALTPTFTPLVAKKPVWVEMDMRQSPLTPFTTIVLDIRDSATTTSLFFRRKVALATEWRRYRFWWIPNDLTAMKVMFPDNPAEPYVAAVSTQFDLGRVVVYQANEPVSHQRTVAQSLALTNGITAPAAVTGRAVIYVDTFDGLAKIKFANGTVKTFTVT